MFMVFEHPALAGQRGLLNRWQVATKSRGVQRLKPLKPTPCPFRNREKLFNWQGIRLITLMAMNLDALMRRIGVSGSLFIGKKSPPNAVSIIKDATRQPNGTFHFTAQLAKGTPFIVQASTNLENWSPVLNGIATGELTSYADGHASRFNYRFYRLQTGQAECSNVLGYVSITLPHGFSDRNCTGEAHQLRRRACLAVQLSVLSIADGPGRVLECAGLRVDHAAAWLFHDRQSPGVPPQYGRQGIQGLARWNHAQQV